jgi:haloalkane dehalogenase
MTKKWFTALALIALGSLTLTSCMPRAASATPASQACLATPETLTTKAGVAFVRTPDACFENLPDWNYEPKYLEIDGLRQAYIDEGPRDADPILLLHGQPSWSYLYRYMIPVLVKGGHRVIAMDHLGMGRSDKPTDLKYHSYANHFNRLDTFIQKLELKHLTVFMQDWGSVLGLDLASQKPDTFDRIILGNGGFPNIDKPYPLPKDVNAAVAQFGQTIRMIPPQQPAFFDAQGRSTIPLNSAEGGANPFGDWIAYAMYAEDFKPSAFIEALTYHPLTPEQRAAYDAPFPNRIMMAAPRTFPSLVNQTAGRYQSVMDGLKRYNKPFLTIFGSNEPGVSPAVQQWFIDNVPGAKGQDHHRLPDASHFLQDDKGAEIAGRINQFIAKNPR